MNRLFRLLHSCRLNPRFRLRLLHHLFLMNPPFRSCRLNPLFRPRLLRHLFLMNRLFRLLRSCRLNPLFLLHR
jgi:hypothetical protein